MSWVKDALLELKQGNEVKVRPQGGSMRGRIESGQLVTLKKIDFKDIQLDDIVFISWKGNYLLHLVRDITYMELLIGNAVGKINGWVPANAVIAKVIALKTEFNYIGIN
ncbi:hypothetical protein [Acetivibrio cellulolyticus]|uniref:hypothetical protein n=1 Tax=Acetivibrio cellulolyticus TaxID=35830 RepID=UPI0001E2C26C|nr:hypothetical protein [Acetivibrio cellulolyticus]